MRQIKFRAWDKKAKEMVQNPIVSSFDWNKGSQGGTHDTLMQFTGLSDKFGVPIYEGDIIGYWAKAHWIVSWVDYRWRLTGGEGWNGSFALSPSALAGKEIIGNIYETPHLLSPITN